LEALKQDARNADKTYQDAKDRERDIMNALARHERHTMEQKVMRQRLEDKISRLKEDLELATPQTGLMNRYKEELEAAEEKSELFSNQYQDSVTAKDSLNEKQREIRNQQSAIDADMQVIEKKKDKAVATLQSLLNAREDSLKQKNLALQWVKESEQRREAKLTERAELLENVKDFMAEATKICDRVPVEAGVSSAMLNQRHEKMSEQLARAQREQGGSEEELKQKELETKEAYEKIFDTLEQLNDLTQTLKHSLVNRRERWEKFREFISIRAKTSFTYLLSERQFRGTLLINHLQKALDIQVEPDITRKSDKGRQTKTLSGGEKSFSTICLLLALWEAMGSPIRCLDEL
jgi:chromosome segregation ATPase